MTGFWSIRKSNCLTAHDGRHSTKAVSSEQNLSQIGSVQAAILADKVLSRLGSIGAYPQNLYKFSRSLPIPGVGIGFAKRRGVAMEGILNKNILIVDDDERMLRALVKTLSSEGAVVTSSQWGGDAIEILARRERNIELVITDLRMPLVTGAALVHYIHLIFPDLPIIVLTAFGSSEAKAECLRQGAAAFLEKNLSTAQLVAEIERVFKSRKLVDEPPAMNATGSEAAAAKEIKTGSSGE